MFIQLNDLQKQVKIDVIARNIVYYYPTVDGHTIIKLMNGELLTVEEGIRALRFRLRALDRDQANDQAPA